ncbi:MAG TPA: phage holin family protein [Steroidobacteraceae bacterium]
MLTSLPRVAPVLARHALGYADLATEEMDGIGTRLRRRLLATAVCGVAASFTVLMCCCLVIAMTWDTPYRAIVIAGLALAFLAMAIVAGEVARRERQRSARLFPRLRSEWNRDREALRQVLAAQEEQA